MATLQHLSNKHDTHHLKTTTKINASLFGLLVSLSYGLYSFVLEGQGVYKLVLYSILFRVRGFVFANISILVSLKD